MEFAHIVDIVASLASMAIIWVGMRLSKISEELASIKGALGSAESDNRREHGEVAGKIDKLSSNLTEEVRGIVRDHSKHEIQSAKMEKDLAIIITRQLEVLDKMRG